MFSRHPDECLKPARLALLWLLLVMLLPGVFLLSGQSVRVDTNILELLPQTQQTPLLIQAQKQLNADLQQRIVWLARGEDERRAVENARALYQQLQQSELFSELQLQWQAENRLYPALLPYRYGFLSKQDRQAITRDAEQFMARRLQLLYSPLGAQYAASLQKDPLFTLATYIREIEQADIDLHDDVAILADGQYRYAVIISRFEDSGFAAQKALAKWHRQLSQQRPDILAAGLPLYSAYGAQSAEREISTVGLVSVLAIIALMLAGFRSLRPLLLTLFSIAIGISSALLASSLVFGSLHVITLVFGSSLIGITVDYSFHYFCDRLRQGQSSLQSLKAVLPGIGLGLGSSVIAYGLLWLTPFPGLRQMGLFSVVGLCMAWLTVVLLYPLLATKMRQRPVPQMFYWYRYRWPLQLYRFRWPLAGAVLLLLAVGFYRLTFLDEIRAMQTPPAALVAEEQAIAEIGQQRPDSQYFIVTADSPQQWQEREQALLQALELLIADQRLYANKALSPFYISVDQQLANHQLLQQQVFDSGLLQQGMQGLQMQPQVIEQLEQDFYQQDTAVISIQEWAQAMPGNLSVLWLGCEPQCSSVVRLYGIADHRVLSDLQLLASQQAGVIFVDTVQDINALLQQYRQMASGFLLLALLLTALFLSVFIGPGGAVRIVLVPFTALLLALASLSLAGFPISMFHIFGLLLALGISLDYAIFHHVGKHPLTTSMSVGMSLLTSLLAFGLLASSNTAFIQAFGLSLALAIVYAFILSPLAAKPDNDGDNYVS